MSKKKSKKGKGTDGTHDIADARVAELLNRIRWQSPPPHSDTASRSAATPASITRRRSADERRLTARCRSSRRLVEQSRF